MSAHLPKRSKDVRAVTTRRRSRQHPGKPLDVLSDRRAALVFVVDQRTDGDVIDPRERLSASERREGSGSDQPSITEKDRGGAGFLHVCRDFGRNLVDAEMRYAALVRKA